MTRGTGSGGRVETGGDPDWLLVEKAAKGDVEALGVLYDRHASSMLALALRILGHAGDAEDLVHDVLIEAWERMRTYDARRASVRAWLLLRVRSRAIDRLRMVRLARESARTYAAPPARALEPALDPERLLEWKHAVSLLGGLSELQREVLDLAYFRGLSAREIALQLRIPHGTAKSRLASALGALRRQIVEPEEDS